MTTAVSKGNMLLELQQFEDAPKARRQAIRFALYAKWLRRHQTKVELKMGELLQTSCSEFRFRRQWPFLKRIADFYCRELRLVIEVDGNSHETDYGKRRDREANQKYQENGYNILRVRNWHVMFVPEKVELVVVSLIQLLRHSEELIRRNRGQCVIMSFCEDPNAFRLI